MRGGQPRHPLPPPVSGLAWGAPARLALVALLLALLWLGVLWCLR